VITAKLFTSISGRSQITETQNINRTTARAAIQHSLKIAKGEVAPSVAVAKAEVVANPIVDGFDASGVKKKSPAATDAADSKKGSAVAHQYAEGARDSVYGLRPGSAGQ
jgi:hypothetical protein